VDNDKTIFTPFLRPEECYSGKEAGREREKTLRDFFSLDGPKASKPFPFPPTFMGRWSP
jgi:hypothetical protein